MREIVQLIKKSCKMINVMLIKAFSNGLILLNMYAYLAIFYVYIVQPIKKTLK